MNKRNISMVAILLVAVSVGVFAVPNNFQNGPAAVRQGQFGLVADNGQWSPPLRANMASLLQEGTETFPRGFANSPAFSPATAMGPPTWAGKGMVQHQQAFQSVRFAQGSNRMPIQGMMQHQQAFQSARFAQGSNGMPVQRMMQQQQAFQGRPRGMRY